MPFLSHLVEIRDRLLRIVLSVLIVFACLFPFANDIYSILAEPLTRHMPQGSSMIATQVASPFLTPFKLTLVLSFFIAIPVVLYHVWSFIAPGLYSHERRIARPLLFVSTVLFFAGMAFAYYVVFPLVFGFFIGIAPEGVAVMTDIASYLDFVLKLFFAFGIAFQMPIFTLVLIMTGFTTAEKLTEKRPYIIVGAFVFGMLLTPPDIISQSLLAIPMWLLFETGIFFSRYLPEKSEQGEDEAEAEVEPDLDAELDAAEADEAALDANDDSDGSKPA